MGVSSFNHCRHQDQAVNELADLIIGNWIFESSASANSSTLAKYLHQTTCKTSLALPIVDAGSHPVRHTRVSPPFEANNENTNERIMVTGVTCRDSGRDKSLS